MWNTRNGPRRPERKPLRAAKANALPPCCPGGRAFGFVRRPGDRSRRIRRVLSIEDVCLSCKRAVPIPAICRGLCVREPLVLLLRRAPTACGWSLRGCRRVAWRRPSPPFSRCYLMVFSSGSFTSSRSTMGCAPAGALTRVCRVAALLAASRPSAGGCRAGPAVAITAGDCEREHARRACSPTRVSARARLVHE